MRPATFAAALMLGTCLGFLAPHGARAACSFKNALVTDDPRVHLLLRSALVGNDEVDPDFYQSVRGKAFFLSSSPAEIENQNEQIRKILAESEEVDRFCPADKSGKLHFIGRRQLVAAVIAELIENRDRPVYATSRDGAPAADGAPVLIGDDIRKDLREKERYKRSLALDKLTRIGTPKAVALIPTSLGIDYDSLDQVLGALAPIHSNEATYAMIQIALVYGNDRWSYRQGFKSKALTPSQIDALLEMIESPFHPEKEWIIAEFSERMLQAPAADDAALQAKVLAVIKNHLHDYSREKGETTKQNEAERRERGEQASRTRQAAFGYVTKVISPETTQVLLEHLNHSCYGSREIFYALRGRKLTPEQMNILYSHLDDEDSEIRQSSLKAIVEATPKEARAKLIPTIVHMLSDKENNNRDTARWMLQDIPTPESTEILLQIALSKPDYRGEQAIEAVLRRDLSAHDIDLLRQISKIKEWTTQGMIMRYFMKTQGADLATGLGEVLRGKDLDQAKVAFYALTNEFRETAPWVVTVLMSGITAHPDALGADIFRFLASRKLIPGEADSLAAFVDSPFPEIRTLALDFALRFLPKDRHAQLLSHLLQTSKDANEKKRLVEILCYNKSDDMTAVLILQLESASASEERITQELKTRVLRPDHLTRLEAIAQARPGSPTAALVAARQMK